MARPRSEDIDERLLAATRELLEEAGYDALTMEAVAERANVGKPALYRRYPTRAHLVFAATVQAAAPPDLPSSGDVRTDLRQAVQLLVFSLGFTPRSVLADQFAEIIRDERFAREVAEKVHAPALEVIHRIWERGVAAGQLRDDVDGRQRLMDLSSALVMRVLYFHLPPSDDELDAIVDHFLDGARPR